MCIDQAIIKSEPGIVLSLIIWYIDFVMTKYILFFQVWLIEFIIWQWNEGLLSYTSVKSR